MKKFQFKYRAFFKAVIMLILFVFCTTTLASDCLTCICSAKQEAKKEMKCCSVKKEMKCCADKDKKCGKTENKQSKDCSQCTMKKSDIQNPLTTNDSKVVKSNILKVTEENLSFNSGNFGIKTYNTWRPPGNLSKIFIALSNIRI